MYKFAEQSFDTPVRSLQIVGWELPRRSAIVWSDKPEEQIASISVFAVSIPQLYAYE